MAGRTGAPFYGGTTQFDPAVFDYAGMRDQSQTAVSAPTFQPFKFEPKRARIDWRLLHGIDIHAMVGVYVGFVQGEQQQALPDVGGRIQSMHVQCVSSGP